MKKYIDVKIDGSKEYLVGILSQMKTTQDADFKYEKELSNGMAMNVSQSIDEVACFKATTKELFRARVYVDINHRRNTEEYHIWIPNIVSSDKDHLEEEEYNYVLKEFIKQVVSKYVPKEKIQLTKENVQLSELISTDSYEKLERWEYSCDHNAPFAHPLDREKWMAFLSSVFYYKDDKKMNSGDLEAWLREDKNWSQYLNNEIQDVALRYEDGIELLHYYNDIYIK